MNTHDAEVSELQEIAQRVARRYCRKVWWANEDDLIQECWHAFAQAANSYRPNKRTPFAGYAQRAAYRWVSGYLWQQSSPVKCSDRTKAKDLQRAPIPDMGHDEGTVSNEARWAMSIEPDMEARMDQERLEVDMEDHVWHAIANVAIDYHLLLDLLNKDVKRRDAAEQLGVPVSHISKLMAEARTQIYEDRDLRAFWREHVRP